MLNIKIGTWNKGTPILNKTIGAINVNIREIENDLDLKIVRDWDELGYFDAASLYINDVEIGIVRHDGSKSGFSGIYLPKSTRIEDAHAAIRLLLMDPRSPISNKEIRYEAYEEPW